MLPYLRIVLVAVALAAVVFTPQRGVCADYRSVIDALSSGDIEAARHELDIVLSDDYADAEALLYYSRLEGKGDIAIEHLRKGLELCEDECGLIVSSLADAYYRQGRFKEVTQLYKDYRKKVVHDDETIRLYWFAALSYLRLDELKDSEKTFNELEKKFSDVYLSGWGVLGKASVKASKGENREARSGLRPLISAGGEVSALAVYNRSYFAARSGDRQNALLGFNLLDERFGNFIGSSELRDLILTGTSEMSSGEAERLTDLTYTVEMGIFRDKTEADRLSGKLRAAQYSVEEKSEIIGDRKYWIVRVGIFRSQKSAMEFKDRLESQIPGTYRVVIR